MFVRAAGILGNGLGRTAVRPEAKHIQFMMKSYKARSWRGGSARMASTKMVSARN